MRIHMTEEARVAMLQALRRAADYAGGSYAALAARINNVAGPEGRISPQGVFKWTINGVPAERAVDIEAALDGKVLRQELRPDLYEGMTIL
jgi:DNA-binding transcriptional regulator YdaS (Cro superfamily)